MPLYEFKCRDCSHLFERIQRYRADAPKCPQCGGGTDRQLSAPAIRFKGTGWYLTDYARKGQVHDKDGSEKDGGGKDGEKKDDTKKKDTSPSANASSDKPVKKNGGKS